MERYIDFTMTCAFFYLSSLFGTIKVTLIFDFVSNLWYKIGDLSIPPVSTPSVQVVWKQPIDSATYQFITQLGTCCCQPVSVIILYLQNNSIIIDNLNINTNHLSITIKLIINIINTIQYISYTK